MTLSLMSFLENYRVLLERKHVGKIQEKKNCKHARCSLFTFKPRYTYNLLTFFLFFFVLGIQTNAFDRRENNNQHRSGQSAQTQVHHLGHHRYVRF